MAKNFLSGLFKKKKDDEPSGEQDGGVPEKSEKPDISHDAQSPAPPLEEDQKDSAPDLSHEAPLQENQTPEYVATPAPEPTAPPAPDDTPQPTPPPEPPQKKGFFSRLKDGLAKTSGRLSDGVTSIFTKRKLDDETLEELEDLLVSADLGVAAASRVTTSLAKDRYDKEISEEEVKQALADEVAKTLSPLQRPLTLNSAHRPHVILMTGVNGAGKTTTIGKLASKFKAEGKSVMLAAGDTFRAAAIEQLSVWGERTGAPVIAKDVGSDAAGLAFDALKQAQAQNIDILLIDTAGRLQNRKELMEELAKIVRVIRKIDETAPHDTLLVLDATVGQNALSQAGAFSEIAGVTGLIMTKLDGTARGGVLVALADKFSLPIHYIGVGESIDDLQPFDAATFSNALAGVQA